MLKQPRRLPNRYARPVTPQMRRIVEQRHHRRTQHRRQKWMRAFQRFQRRAAQLKGVLLRYVAVLIGSIVLLCIGLALFSPILHIREIRVQRADPRVDAERIQGALAPFFGRHLFFLTTDQVEQAIAASIPDLHTVTITKQYPGTLSLHVTLDPLIARLVIDDPETPVTGSGTSTGSGTLSGMIDYLTDEGVYVAYNPAQVESGSALTQLRVVDWAVRPEPNKQIMSPELLGALSDAELLLEREFDQSVTRRTVYLRAREFHLRLPAYSLWFDLRSPLDEQLRRYRVYLDQIGADKAKEYVDLRIQGKIVYK